MSSAKEVRALKREAGHIANRIRDLLKVWIKEEDDVATAGSSSPLYLAHYTSLQAVVSMLQSTDGGLRLSDSSTMNDPEEGRATVEGRTILSLLESECGKDSWLWQRYSAANVCCFVGIVRASATTIDAGDDLLFWRLYGNDCRGVSITIPPHVSENLVRESIVDRVAYADSPAMDIEVTEFARLLRDVNDLRSRAQKASSWSDICSSILPTCDKLFKQRFLRKRLHYGMESEYRAVAFISEDDAEDSRYSLRGEHVQGGLVRKYVQIPELSCKGILTTGSRITIGSNVSEHDDAREAIRRLLPSSTVSPDAVSVGVSRIPYRPR